MRDTILFAGCFRFRAGEWRDPPTLRVQVTFPQIGAQLTYAATQQEILHSCARCLPNVRAGDESLHFETFIRATENNPASLPFSPWSEEAVRKTRTARRNSAGDSAHCGLSREGGDMRYFELMESGLPADSFMACECEPGQPKRRVRFRPNSPWKNNRKVGERLSWRGRSFVEAFADVNRREILKTALIELQPGQAHVAMDAWQPGTASDERFHFICQSSPGAYMRIGEEDVPLTPGDMWRVDDRFHPAVLRAGAGLSLHLLLVLSRGEAAQVEPGNENYENFDVPRIIVEPQRSQVAV